MARFVMDVSPFVCQGGRMTPQQRHALVRNNLVAYLLGGGLMVLIHEVVHWLVGAALGYRSTMFSYGVTMAPTLAPVPSDVPPDRAVAGAPHSWNALRSKAPVSRESAWT